MSTRWMDSPIGGLRLHVAAGLITRIEFDAEPRGTRVAEPLLDRAEAQLEAYFGKELREFDLPIANDGTEFQQRVWNALRAIPYGQTATYGEIAARLGYAPGISRAVGAANGANPIPIVVPCHRVIGSNGTLTGYAGGIERKRVLLELEQPALF
ncbi:methylated-DNA--[protein]-cysteine S-methyltransferase [Aeromicrobium phragmitis]|uniref:Methylated-DNA--protein-cysteine methyltransferase n=1 Tax=Aeromicrobium phragmitis TaxID=2478914 RepID=A0A3L8PMQ5_9ACTN|nr:methylated-DNA--[protein]-cysteine S-methyltransferase [Aeromicrobium phragmitis]RLV56635.1 methylated-DNA--[protein]-cysteine S-methyltransferase [Aeromicrobium phragmitis]